MMSSATKVKSQGVGSAFMEHFALMKKLDKSFEVLYNHKKKKKQCDIVHYHTIDPAHYLKVMMERKKTVSVASVHFLPETLEKSIQLPWLFKKVLYKYLIHFYKAMDNLVVVNPVFIDKLEMYGVDPYKVKYIPNFVSFKNFYPLSEDEKIKEREALGIDKDKFVVLSVGQMQTRKGIFDFFELAKTMPHVQFMWAGDFSFKFISDGYNEIKEAINNLPSNVLLLGNVPRERMNIVYNTANVMLLPSFDELFPMAILEAMNCNIPILLRDLDIYPPILFDFYAKGKNINEFKDVINQMINDKDYYTQCCDGSHRGCEFYSEENVANLWVQYYRNLKDVSENKVLSKSK